MITTDTLKITKLRKYLRPKFKMIKAAIDPETLNIKIIPETPQQHQDLRNFVNNLNKTVTLNRWHRPVGYFAITGEMEDELAICLIDLNDLKDQPRSEPLII